MKNIIFLLFLVSCAPYKHVDLTSLKIGMNKQQVYSSINKKPDNLIGAKKYPNGTIEVLQYSKRSEWTGFIEEEYWLYFWNDSLNQWGRPGDWEKEADRIYEIRLD
jgi:hypothetical protein